jgi:hypothetical protein
VGKEKVIKVQAIRLGFFEKRRIYEGQVFMVKESEFSKFWMKEIKVDGKAKSKPEAKPEEDKAIDDNAI